MVPDAAAQLLASDQATLPSLRDFSLRNRALDDFAALGWHTTRMWRVAAGKDPRPGEHPLLGAAGYLRGTVTSAVSRALTHPPRYR